MIARLEIPRAWMWSAWQPDRGMNFNSYFFERDAGAVVGHDRGNAITGVDAMAAPEKRDE